MSLFDVGGMMEELPGLAAADGGGDDDKKKAPAPKDPDAYEKMMTNKWLGGKLPGSDRPTYDILKQVAEETGGEISPELLGGSVAQEGGVWAYTRPNEKSGAYLNSTVDKKQFPVDAFKNYGLDNITTALPDLIKKGYLPADFGNRMKPFKASNEQDEKKYYQTLFTQLQQEGTIDKNAKFETGNKSYDMIDEKAKYLKSQAPVLGQSANTAAFKTHEDAIRAKAAFMRDFQDKVKDKITKSGAKVSKEDRDKITLVAYNAGMGNANDVIEKMAAYKGKDFWGEYEAGHSYVKNNVNPRLKKGKWISEYGTKNSKNLPKKETGTMWGSGILPASSLDASGSSTGGY